MQTIKNIITKRAKNLKLKNLSAPALFGTIILFSMLLIFTFESIGLTKKEKEINLTLKPNRLVKENKTLNNLNQLGNFRQVNNLNKNEQLNIMMNMLYESALLQLENESIEKREELNEFFDL